MQLNLSKDYKNKNSIVYPKVLVFYFENPKLTFFVHNKKFSAPVSQKKDKDILSELRIRKLPPQMSWVHVQGAHLRKLHPRDSYQEIKEGAVTVSTGRSTSSLFPKARSFEHLPWSIPHLARSATTFSTAYNYIYTYEMKAASYRTLRPTRLN